jgi:hypothetical protein
VPELGTRPLQKITSTDIDNLYSKLKESTVMRGKKAVPLAARTLHHVHVVLGACLKQAVRKKLIPISPIESADVPEVGKSEEMADRPGTPEAAKAPESASMVSWDRNGSIMTRSRLTRLEQFWGCRGRAPSRQCRGATFHQFASASA